MKKTGKSNGGAKHNHGKSERSDKKSATGVNGSPKKGGHGGKYTWSGDGYSQAEIGGFHDVLDVKDPNFEDPEDTVNA